MNGLNQEEIKERINKKLVNNEKITNSRSIKKIIITNIINLFNLIHIILFIIVLTTKSLNNSAFIFAIIINISISIYQEIKAKKIIDKLTITNQSNITVIRNSEIKEINPNEIVIDDLLYLKPGDTLSVDAIIIKTNYSEIDESIITGESNLIPKKNGDKQIAGSIIINGIIYAKVTSINKETYTNNLLKEATKYIENTSYLKQCIESILKIVTIIIIPIGLLLFITQYFINNQSYTSSALTTVAGLIGMIPDGLVLLTSISLTVGIIKMAKHNVIIQKLNGIEQLACIDIMCLDKTGTITDGTMNVIKVIKLSNKENINEIISNMIIDKINATDIALSNYFKQSKKLEIINYIPFSSSRKYSLVKFNNGIYALGALEYITNKQTNQYKMLSKYIDKGYRIITLVKCKNNFNINKNKILSFIIIKDNIRKNAKETIEYFKKQNVKIKIISGDHPETISNIFKQINLKDYNNYISGEQLPSDYQKLKEIVNNYTIFGRTTPYQKQIIIKALKETSNVGMIGDGVNDLLALKEADCAITLSTGITATKSVSEIVLNDLDFGILPHLVNEGRRVVNNIERVASMYLIKTIYSFLISLICIILRSEYPFYPIQLSLIGITCVGIPSFFIALEPNYNKIKKGFLINVFRNALPSAISITISFILLIIFSKILNKDFNSLRIIIIASTGYLNLRLLNNISKPLSFTKKTLIYICTSSFYLLILIFHKFFMIEAYNITSIILIIIFVIINNNISLSLEKIYDKIILRIQNKKE